MKSQITETVTISEACHTLRQTARIYFSKDRLGNYRMERSRARPVCLMGPSGIGKTEIVRQVAEEMDLAFLAYSITHHTRQSIIGLPRLVTEDMGGVPCSVTEYTMSEIMAQVYRTMKKSGKQEGILFLDEFNCASESLRPILLQLLQDKTFGPYSLPDGWMLVLAGNPTEYNRSAADLDPVTADRLRLVHIRPDYPAWRKHMIQREVHPVILSYLDNHRDHFYVYRYTPEGTALTTARGWEDLSHMLLFLEQEQEQPDLALVSQYIQSADIARSFFGYYTQYAALLSGGLIERILTQDPNVVQTIRKMSFDRSWNLVAALLCHLQNRAKEVLDLDSTTAGVHSCLKQLGEMCSHDQNFELDSGLLKAAADASDVPVRRFLTDCVACSQGEDGWSRVKEKFALELHAPRMKAYEELALCLENAIRVCRAALDGKPHLEFLFNILSESAAITDVLACHPNTEFQCLLRDVYVCADSEDERLTLLFGDEEEESEQPLTGAFGVDGKEMP